MASLRGGMEFVGGKPVRLKPPEAQIVSPTLRLTCRQRPDVVLGQTVEAGQIISAPVDAAHPCRICPIAGTVHSIIRRPGPGPRQQRGRTGPSLPPSPQYDVTILPAAPTALSSLPIDPPRDTALESWQSAMRSTGPWPLAGLGFDLVSELAAAQKSRPDTLICLGLDIFVPHPDRSSILGSFPADAALGTSAMAQICGASSVMMLVGNNNRPLDRLRKNCRNFSVKLNCVDNVYPAGDPTLVLWAHASGQRKLPHGSSPMSQGVLLITPWTAIRLARWLTRKRLDVVSPMLIGRPQAGAPMNWRYTFAGQELASLDAALVGQAGALHGRVVLGNPMTGQAPRELSSESGPLPPVVPDDEHLISLLSPSAIGVPEPCVTCGWCVDVCPTRLRPIHLVQLAEKSNGKKSRSERRLAAHLPWCIDCGLCTHACPSHLPLGQMLREACLQRIVNP